MHLLSSLPLFLAQATDNTLNTLQQPPHVSMVASLIGSLIGTTIAFVILGIFILGILRKAGFPAPAAFVPFYNIVLLCRAAGKPDWLVVLMVIPFLNVITGLIAWIIIALGLGKTFNKSGGFVAGLILVSIVFLPILGYGDSRYVGDAGGSLTGTDSYPTV